MNKDQHLIYEAYQQLNEWGGELDPTQDLQKIQPKNAIDVLKYRLAQLKGSQDPRTTADYVHNIVDTILHKKKLVSAEEVQAVLRAAETGQRSGDRRTGEWSATPLFNDELIKQIMAPLKIQ